MLRKNNPPNYTRLTILRILAAQYPDAVEGDVLEKTAPQGTYSCKPATIRDNLSSMIVAGDVEAQVVSPNEYTSGSNAYRVTEQGLAELDAWLPPIYELPTNCRVSYSDFDESVERSKSQIPDLRR